MAAPRFPILFISATRIGDAVLSSGLLKRLVDEIPDARFTIVAGPLAAPLFRDTPGLERLIPFEKRRFGLHWLDLWKIARRRRWGLVLDMRGSGIAKFVNARRRAVRKPPPPGSVPVHKVIEAARVLKVDDDPPSPFLFTSAETEAEAQAFLKLDDRPILAIAPAANWVGKTWPAERFAVVAAELLAKDGLMPNGRLLVLGGPEDRWACEPVRRALPRDRLIDGVGKLDLLAAYACLKRVRLFIGNDSGLMHLAAAAGTPTLGLFGPSDDRLYGPWGPHARAIRGPREFETFKEIDPGLNQALCHMFDLPASRVVAAAKALFQETEPKPEPEPAPEPQPQPQPEPEPEPIVHRVVKFEAVQEVPPPEAPPAPEADPETGSPDSVPAQQVRPRAQPRAMKPAPTTRPPRRASRKSPARKPPTESSDA